MVSEKVCAISHKDEQQKESKVQGWKIWMRMWLDCTNDPCTLKKVFTVMKELDKGKKDKPQTTITNGLTETIIKMLHKADSKQLKLIHAFLSSYLSDDKEHSVKNMEENENE